MTLQRLVQNLPKFLNATFGSAAGIAPEWRGKHLAYAIVLKLLTDFVFVATDFGTEIGQSILDHWKTEDGKHTYPVLGPTLEIDKYPCCYKSDSG